MITMQSGIGPCGMMDRMGLGVVHHVAKLIGESVREPSCHHRVFPIAILEM
jgi:hypothetical protein